MTEITRLNIIVHSMGNRLVAEALQAAAPRLQSKKYTGAIVLAAPDINVDRFRQLAAVYPLVAESTTMYVSERDRALGASRYIWDSPRAGLTPPVTVVPGVYTIEVSDIDVSRLGHGYYAGLILCCTTFAKSSAASSSPGNGSGYAKSRTHSAPIGN